MADRPRDEHGFALAVAIMALVLVAAVVAGGFFSASQEVRIGQGMKSVAASFYAGESGVQRLLAEWEPAAMNALAPGDSLSMGPFTLDGGSTYSVRVVRVDGDEDPRKRYFYIEALGRGFRASLGERRQGALARVRFHRICCDAALATTDETQIGSNSKVYGLNTDPLSWLDAGACVGLPTGDAPGILTPDLALIDASMGDVRGQPDPIVADAALNPASLFVFEDLGYSDIAERADIVLPAATSISAIAPAIRDSKCDRSVSSNWGAPHNTSHACFHHFPIIHALGDLSIDGDDAGQGILVVDGDLYVAGQFTFYGIILVRGRIEATGRARIRGGLVVRGDSEEISFTQAPNARIELSRCAIERAQRLSALARGQLLERRAWIDLF